MHAARYTAKQMCTDGYTVERRRAGDYAVEQMHAVGNVAEQMRAARYAAKPMRADDYTLKRMRTGGYVARHASSVCSNSRAMFPACFWSLRCRGFVPAGSHIERRALELSPCGRAAYPHAPCVMPKSFTTDAH